MCPSSSRIPPNTRFRFELLTVVYSMQDSHPQYPTRSDIWVRYQHDQEDRSGIQNATPERILNLTHSSINASPVEDKRTLARGNESQA